MFLTPAPHRTGSTYRASVLQLSKLLPRFHRTSLKVQETENPKTDEPASSAETLNKRKWLFLNTWSMGHSQPLYSFTKMSVLIVYKLFNIQTLFFIKVHIQCDHGMWRKGRSSSAERSTSYFEDPRVAGNCIGSPAAGSREKQATTQLPSPPNTAQFPLYQPFDTWKM